MSIFDWEKPLPDVVDFCCELKDFPVYRQETDHTCGPSATRMVLKYLGSDVPEKKIARRALTNPLGTFHWTLRNGFSHYASRLGFKVELSGDDSSVYQRIKDELVAGRPVMFVYAVVDDFHPPQKVTHYGVVTGIDEPAGTVTVANPFGVLEKIPLNEWWGRFSLLPEFMPKSQLPLVALGLLKPRTAFFLQPR